MSFAEKRIFAGETKYGYEWYRYFHCVYLSSPQSKISTFLVGLPY